MVLEDPKKAQASQMIPIYKITQNDTLVNSNAPLISVCRVYHCPNIFVKICVSFEKCMNRETRRNALRKFTLVAHQWIPMPPVSGCHPPSPACPPHLHHRYIKAKGTRGGFHLPQRMLLLPAETFILLQRTVYIQPQKMFDQYVLQCLVHPWLLERSSLIYLRMNAG